MKTESEKMYRPDLQKTVIADLTTTEPLCQ
jgi:hypothetical protein